MTWASESVWSALGWSFDNLLAHMSTGHAMALHQLEEEKAQVKWWMSNAKKKARKLASSPSREESPPKEWMKPTTK